MIEIVRYRFALLLQQKPTEAEDGRLPYERGMPYALAYQISRREGRGVVSVYRLPEDGLPFSYHPDLDLDSLTPKHLPSRPRSKENPFAGWSEIDPWDKPEPFDPKKFLEETQKALRLSTLTRGRL